MIKSLLQILALSFILNTGFADSSYKIPYEDLVHDHDHIHVFAFMKDGDVFGVDVTSIKEGNDITSVLLVDFFNSGPPQMGVGRIEINCKNQTLRMVDAAIQNMKLTLLASEPINGKFKTPVKDSAEEPLMEYICQKKYLNKSKSSKGTTEV